MLRNGNDSGEAKRRIPMEPFKQTPNKKQKYKSASELGLKL